MNKIFEQQIIDKWAPKIRKKIEEKGLKNISESRINTIAKMAHSRALHESAGFSSPGTVTGRGGFAFGNNPGAGNAGFYGAGAKGSSEAFQNLFGVFIEVAATNIGMELVPVIPATKSSGMFHVAEPVYGGGRLNSTEAKPVVIQAKLTANGTAATQIPFSKTNIGTEYQVVETSGTDNIIKLTFLGKHRVNGNWVFKVGVADAAYLEETIADCLDSATNGARILASSGANYWSFVAGSVDLVAGFSSLVSGFTGAGTDDSDAWYLDRQDGKRYTKPMSRETGENQYSRTMGIRTWHKNYAAETFKTKLTMSNEQVQDMNADLGMSADEFSDLVMVDQLNQDINNHILGTIFALGWQHHYDLNQASNGAFNMNAFINASGSTGSAQSFLGAADSLLTIAGNSGVLPATGAISENLSTLQRRVVTRMLYASGVIKSKSRRGKADQAVVNTTFSTALQDIRGFQANPFDNNLSVNSDLEKIGKLYNMEVYEDGLMGFEDQRISVSRKGTEKDPGLKFLPYILSERVTTVSEQGMNPTKMLMSRYSLIAAGTFPQTNYMTFTVESGNTGYALV